MRKRLGKAYYGFAAAAACAVAATVALAEADADAAALPAAEPAASTSADPEGMATEGRDGAVDTCLSAAADRYDAEVSLAQVNRAWLGTEGWIVDLSVDVTKEGGRARRRDALCRQSEHGLQVARY